MSGYKRATIKISDTDYRRLHDADMKGRFSNVAQRQENRQREEARVLQSTLQRFEQRQQEFQQYIQGLSNDIGQIEVATAQTLVGQHEDLHQELSEHLASLQEDTSVALDTITRDLSNQIESEQRKHFEQLIRLTTRLDDLSGDSDHKIDLASQWLDSAVGLRNFIETHYDHNRFLPGQFELIDLEMQQAMGYLQDEMPEAALLGAQQVYVECSQKRLELERLTGEWEILYQNASDLLDEIIRILRAGKTITALDTMGRELPERIDLRQWSENRYINLVHHVRDLRSRLQTEADNLTSAELVGLIKNVLPGLKNEFDDLVYRARLAAIYSQIRINIADIAIQALERQGFMVNEHGFVENNMRNPYLISLENIEGSQVLIHVDPIRSAEAANDLVIESHDKDIRTESELRSRSQEILRALTLYGLQVGPVSIDRSVILEGSSLVPKKKQAPSTSLHYQEKRHD